MPSSKTRTPSVTVYANGAILPGVLEVEVEANSHLGANRFTILASLDASGAAIWAQDALQFQIEYTLNIAAAVMIIGAADRLSIDPIRGEVRVDGRDLTSRFIAARTEEAFENQTASEVATMLATRQGLQAMVTPTTTPIGRYYQNSHTRTTLGQHARATTEWDLLVKLAELEGFDVWVDGETLHFMSPLGQFGILPVSPSDCLSISLEKSLTLSSSLEVIVTSWDCRGMQAVKQMAASSGSTAQTSYVIVRPNLTSVAAQTLAQNVINQMASHAQTIRLEMPGDIATVPRMMLALGDTGTDFDGSYVISSVERRISFAHGFTQCIEARTPYWTISST